MTAKNTNFTAWTAKDLATFKAMARSGVGGAAIASKLGRTLGAVHQYAARNEISLKGTHRRKPPAARSRAGVAEKGAVMAAKAKRKVAGPQDVTAFTRAAKAKKASRRAA